MTVYLLHLNQPLSRGVSAKGTTLTAGHYIGYTSDLVGRIMDHMEGHGARFTQVCVERGVKWSLARTWDGDRADRRFERYLKNMKNAPRLCPICNPKAMNWAKLEDLP
jgi:predicted GIY-YIG superfamily endonuclease